MGSHKNRLTFTVPLGRPECLDAERLSKQHVTSQKIKQVYLNTLAVSAVNFYLQCLGIETDLESSDSWNPLMQHLLDVADLCIPPLGKLECRPILPTHRMLYVPPEVWSDRIGFIGVAFNESLTEATLVGFVQTVDSEEIPLHNLESLSSFIVYLNALQPAQTIRLSHWFSGVIEAGWQKVEEILQPSPEFAFNFRYHGSVQRGKLLHLEPLNQPIALLVGLQQAPADRVKVLLEIHSGSDRDYLPENLKLMLLDHCGTSVMEAIAKSTNRNIQFEFSGEIGEQFSIQVSLGEYKIAQAFTI